MGDFLDPGRKYLLIPKKGGERPSVAPVEPRKPTRTALASQLCEKLSSEIPMHGLCFFFLDLLVFFGFIAWVHGLWCRI